MFDRGVDGSNISLGLGQCRLKKGKANRAYARNPETFGKKIDFGKGRLR